MQFLVRIIVVIIASTMIAAAPASEYISFSQVNHCTDIVIQLVLIVAPIKTRLAKD
jgi:hypothetical protein